MKNLIQDKARELSLIHPNLILGWGTGCGKGLALMKCIEASKSKLKWLILVPETVLIENFKADLIKHGYEWLLESKIADIICYASLKNYKDGNYNIGGDEGHHISDLRLDILSSIHSDQRILLTATMPLEVKERLGSLGLWYEYNITTQEAIDLGILPEPQLYIKKVMLDDKQVKYVYKTKTKTIKLTALEYYKKLDAKIQYWKEEYDLKGGQWRKDNWMFAAINRKRWLAEYKTESSKEILKLIRGERSVIFTGSVKQAKELGGKQAIHSKNTTKQNLELISDFNTLKSDKLYACGMLQEGHNLTEIQSGVIIQLANNERYITQTAGRVLRSIAPKIYILCVVGTQDAYYLDKTLLLFKNKPIYL